LGQIISNLAFIKNLIQQWQPSWICKTVLLDYPQSHICGMKKPTNKSCHRLCRAVSMHRAVKQ